MEILMLPVEISPLRVDLRVTLEVHYGIYMVRIF